MLTNLGSVYNSLGEYEQVKGLYEQSLALMEELGDRLGMGNALTNWGNTLVTMGNVVEAEVCLTEVIFYLYII